MIIIGSFKSTYYSTYRFSCSSYKINAVYRTFQLVSYGLYTHFMVYGRYASRDHHHVKSPASYNRVGKVHYTFLRTRRTQSVVFSHQCKCRGVVVPKKTASCIPQLPSSRSEFNGFHFYSFSFNSFIFHFNFINFIRLETVSRYGTRQYTRLFQLFGLERSIYLNI